MNRTVFRAAALATATLLSPLTAWYCLAQQGGPPPPLPPPPTTSTVLGQALPGLTAAQQQNFDDGRRTFTETETFASGLGPVFNGVSCAECHKAGAIGGAGLDLGIALETRIGGIVNGQYSDLTNLGGPVIQARSLHEFYLSCPIPPEVVPPGTPFVSHRITTPVFGDGLIEAIPTETILARVGQPDPDGVQGVPNMVSNPESGKTEVGRFGWKAQHSTIHLFAGDAYLNEMGVTSPSFPTKNLPQGKPIPPPWAGTPGLNDDGSDITAFTNFIQLLAPPGRRIPVSPAAIRGEQLFGSIRCAACHTPMMQTGENSIAALSHQPVPLYSDLLVHHMGPDLADGIEQGTAKGDQFRTAPLWGLSRRLFFLHDGRAGSPEQALLMHAGEATAARNRYQHLSPQDQQALLEFLNSL